MFPVCLTSMADGGKFHHPFCHIGKWFPFSFIDISRSPLFNSNRRFHEADFTPGYCPRQVDFINRHVFRPGIDAPAWKRRN